MKNHHIFLNTKNTSNIPKYTAETKTIDINEI